MKYGSPAVLVMASRENFRSCFGDVLATTVWATWFQLTEISD